MGCCTDRSFPPVGKLPFPEVGASIASLSRLYSSKRDCLANDNEPFAAVETEPCLYSIGGTELARVPLADPGTGSPCLFPPSGFMMDERGVRESGTCSWPVSSPFLA